MTPEAEQQYISVFETHLAQRHLDAGLHQCSHSRIGLQRQHHAIALRLQIKQRLSKSPAPERAPIQVVDAALESLLYGLGGNSVARGHAEAAHFETGAAESSSFHD